MNKKRISIITIVCISIVTFLNYEKIVSTITTNNPLWYTQQIQLTLNDTLGDSIYSIQKSDTISIYNTHYQNAVEKKIASTLQQSNQPLLLYNPFGTNTSSFYYTFQSEEAYDITYQIHVDDEAIKDYTQNAKTHQINDTTYAYQFIGFVHGKQNTLTISYKKQDEIVKQVSYTIQMPNSKNADNQILSRTTGTSTQPLSEGLFAVFGLDKNYESNVYIYDNDGIMRSEYVLKNYRSDRILFIGDDMLYAYQKNGFIKVNSLGKIIAVYNFDGYTQHHDFIYDEKNNKLLVLANEKGSDTIEDVIVAYDLKSGEIDKIIDMKDLLPTLYEQAISPAEGNTYGGDELDWIHLNSLSLDGDSLVISAREVSTIIKIDAIYTKPNIAYMIADASLYKKDTQLQSLLLQKEGDFISQAGQHSVTYSEDEHLEANQYYLTMYNNNFTSSRTRQDLDYSAFANAGNYNTGDASYYYQYLVDEKNNTYTLTKSFPLPYSSIVSNIQDYQNAHITSSGKAHCFNEYDENGTLIAQFNYEAKKYAYRVNKYDFSSFYFQ